MERGSYLNGLFIATIAFVVSSTTTLTHLIKRQSKVVTCRLLLNDDFEVYQRALMCSSTLRHSMVSRDQYIQLLTKVVRTIDKDQLHTQCIHNEPNDTS